VTKLVAQAGLFYFRPPLLAQSVIFGVLGSSAISAPSMTALGFAYGWYCDVQGLFMPAVAHAGKLRGELKMRRRFMAIAIGLAIVLGLLGTLSYMIYQGYHRGGYNVYMEGGGGGGRIAGEAFFNAMTTKMQNPVGPGFRKLFFMGIGAFLMGGLTFMKYRFVWFPLHPIGLTVAAAWPLKYLFSSMFLAWLSKTVILRFGGISLYRRTVPLFVGLVVGQCVGLGMGLIVNLILFPGAGYVPLLEL
jgi:hypothetical protein